MFLTENDSLQIKCQYSIPFFLFVQGQCNLTDWLMHSTEEEVILVLFTLLLLWFTIQYFQQLVWHTSNWYCTLWGWYFIRQAWLLFCFVFLFFWPYSSFRTQGLSLSLVAVTASSLLIHRNNQVHDSVPKFQTNSQSSIISTNIIMAKKVIKRFRPVNINLLLSDFPQTWAKELWERRNLDKHVRK